MAYADLKKEIRSCKTCNKKKPEMLYVRDKKWHEWFYVCLAHAPFDREKYAIVEIDNRNLPTVKKVLDNNKKKY